MKSLGRCHCGDTQFELDETPSAVTRCMCSICAKRGALWAYCRPAGFRLVKQPAHESTYQWNKHFVKLHFCGICGCTTYNESPSSIDGAARFDMPLIAVNARLLSDFDLDAVRVRVVEGRDLW